MKNNKTNSQNAVSNRQLRDFFTNSKSIEVKKEQSERRIMENEMKRATGGKNIVFSNNCK